MVGSQHESRSRMSGHTTPAIAYSLSISANKMSVSEIPDGWPLLGKNITFDDFLSCWDTPSQTLLKTNLNNLSPKEAGKSFVLSDHRGVKWAMTATLAKNKRQISGGVMSLAAERGQRQLREIINHLPSLIWYKDDANHILSANSAAAASLGLTITEVEGQRTEDLFPEMAASYLEDDQAVIRSGRPQLGYIERLTPAGKPDRWVRTDKIPFNDPVTGRAGVVAMSTDVTKLVELEQQNADLNRRFITAVDASGFGLWEYSLSDPAVAWWSDKMYDILGIELCPPLSLEQCVPLAHPDDKSRLIEMLYDVIGNPRSFSVQFRLRHSRGDYIWIEADGIVDKNENGRAWRMRGSFKNIDERKQSEDALKTYAARLEGANEKLDSFAYIASHDLKAPLRGLANLITWLEEDLPADLRASFADNLTLMRSRLSRMEGLLKDLRLYSHVGREKTAHTDIDLAQLLPSLLDLTDEQAAVTLDLADNLPTIACPESAARHIFLNLITNSIKHGLTNDIKVHVDAIDVAGGTQVAMEDNGPGIEPAYRDRVFLPFKTLKPRDDVEGSGIGLSIVQKLMESLGGRVWIEDPRHGSGARIMLFFPNGQKSDLIAAQPETEKAIAS